jgi:ATP-binding cassette subfamily A (ABC1) protein 3
MNLLSQQIWALTEKNLLILFSRERAWYTYYRSFAIPVLFACYVAFILRVYFPNEKYQIGNAVPVRSLVDGMNAASGGRNTLALVNSGLSGGDVDRVIRTVADEVQSNGKTVKLLSNETDLLELCPSTLRGVTKCYAAAIFYSSPNEGPAGFWNYTIKTDGSFGGIVNLGKSNNDAQIYPMPLQHAIDSAITSLNDNSTSLPDRVDEYPYASKTQSQFKESIRLTLQKTIINVIACVFFLAFGGVVYQLVGLMAMERELGMSQLIESMMPNTRHWEPQAARIISFFTAFSIVYFPGYLVIGLVLKFGLYDKTSAGIVVIFFILAGLATTSFSIFGGSFFKKAQMSGVATIIVGVGLAIIAQVVSKSSTSTINVLSLLFTPMTIVYFIIFMSRYESEKLATNILKAAPFSPWKVPGIVFWIFLLIQIFVYPMMGAIVERYLYDTTSRGRTLSWQLGETNNPVRLTNVTKRYLPNGFFRYIAPLLGYKKKPVVAVNNLSMTATKGQITVLVGANGSGKSTTLDLVAGLTSVTGGSVALDGTGGIGVCPQKVCAYSLSSYTGKLLTKHNRTCCGTPCLWSNMSLSSTNSSPPPVTPKLRSETSLQSVD